MRYLKEYEYLVESWDVLLVYPAVYLAVVGAVYLLQTSRCGVTLNGPVLKGWMMIYNVIQIVVCSYMFSGIAFQNWDMTGDAESPIPDVIIGFFGWKQKFSKELEWFCFVHFLSKFLDLLDTLFILLKRDFHRLTFLHLYHHASIILIWGWILKTGFGNGTGGFGAAINSGIHALMYTHYLIRALGLNNPFKKMVTQAQLSQFYLCVTHAAGGFFFLTPHWDQAECERHDKPCYLSATVQISYHITMIILFNMFYRKAYKKNKISPAGAEAKSKEKAA